MNQGSDEIGEREAAEAAIRTAFDDGDVKHAATLALDRYGDELLGYLTALAKSADVGEEVFQRLCEDLWKGLPQFQWRSSMRTWLYVLARNAHTRYRRGPYEARRRGLDELAEIEQKVRTRTRPWLRTEVKDRFAELRAELSEEEQTLLILRIDRKMAWNDVAEVLGEEGAGASARIRQRFTALEKKLEQRAVETGLVDGTSD